MSNPFYFYDSTNIDYILLLRIDIKTARETWHECGVGGKWISDVEACYVISSCRMKSLLECVLQFIGAFSIEFYYHRVTSSPIYTKFMPFLSRHKTKQSETMLLSTEHNFVSMTFWIIMNLSLFATLKSSLRSFWVSLLWFTYIFNLRSIALVSRCGIEQSYLRVEHLLLDVNQLIEMPQFMTLIRDMSRAFSRNYNMTLWPKFAVIYAFFSTQKILPYSLCPLSLNVALIFLPLELSKIPS